MTKTFNIWILNFRFFKMVDSVKKNEFINLGEAARELNVTKYTLRELLYKEKGLIDGFIIDNEFCMRRDAFSRVKPEVAKLLRQNKY